MRQKRPFLLLSSRLPELLIRLALLTIGKTDLIPSVFGRSSKSGRRCDVQNPPKKRALS